MLRKQRGMTLISWVIVGSFVGMLFLAVLKIMPAYMSYASVKSIMDDLPRDEKIKGMTAKSIRDLIQRRLDVNDLRSISNNKDAFKFTKINDGFKMTLKYEERGNLVGNLDYIVVFDHEVDLNVH